MSIGVNLRVTGHCRQGGRKYMEDFFSVAYQQTEDERDLEYAFIGIYDGHGGAEAAAFAKEHLMETIIKHKNFWSEDDEDVLRAIKDGYIATHYAMWKEQDKWPRTASGLPSTAGTTASVAFIRRGKIYIGHVGDSGIILGYQDPYSTEWKSKPLTKDHKPENADEMSRIHQCGGKVISKSGVPRVVWNRPRIGHQGPVRRSTPIDEIPFLAVARSLGDLWSYNSRINQFVVSPDPDCSVISVDTNIHRCLIFGTDGLYNMLSPQMAVHIVHQAEKHNESAALGESFNKTWLNPSKLLVERALERWHNTKMRADNTSVVTLMLDPPGPPRAQVLKSRKKNYPDSGLKIMTRYEISRYEEGSSTSWDDAAVQSESVMTDPTNTKEETGTPSDGEIMPETCSPNPKNTENCKADSSVVTSSDITSNCSPLKERNFVPKCRESILFDPREPVASLENGKENQDTNQHEPLDDSIQINEISSSSSDLYDQTDTENDPSKNSKHNLRSSNRIKSDTKIETPDKPTLFKRTNAENEEEPLRKSIRLDLNKRRSEGTIAKDCRILRKTIKSVRKFSLAQKILKSKKLNLKKKSLVKKTLPKNRLKLVLSSVKSKSSHIDSPLGRLKSAQEINGSKSNVALGGTTPMEANSVGDLLTNSKRNSSQTNKSSKTAIMLEQIVARGILKEAKSDTKVNKIDESKTNVRNVSSSDDYCLRSGSSNSRNSLNKVLSPKVSLKNTSTTNVAPNETEKDEGDSKYSHSVEDRRSTREKVPVKPLQGLSKSPAARSFRPRDSSAASVKTKPLRHAIRQKTQQLGKRVARLK